MEMKANTLENKHPALFRQNCTGRFYRSQIYIEKVTNLYKLY